MKGNLADRSTPDILSEVQRRQASGILRLQHGESIRQVFIDAGVMIRFAVSNFPGESMTGLLQSKGSLTEQVLKDAAASKTPEELFGTTLVRLGHLTRQALADLTEAHIRTVLNAALSMGEGTYEFQQGALPFRDQLDGGLSTAEVLLEWVRKTPDVEWIRSRLGTQGRVLQRAHRPPEGYQKVPLDSTEGFTMSRVDAPTSVHDLCMMSPMGEDETLRALVGLLLAGILEFGEETPPPKAKPRRQAAPESSAGTTPAAAPSPPLASGGAAGDGGSRCGNGGAPVGAGTAASRKPAPRKPAPTIERVRPRPSSELESEMLERFDQIGAMNLYQVLGVLPTASADELRRAYYGLAKRLHPDKFVDEKKKGKAEKVFARITESYATLSHAETRHHYDEEAAARSTSRDQNQASNTSEMAHMNFKRGKELFDKGKFAEAMSFFQNSCKQDPSKPDYFNFLAQTLAKHPRWKKEAESNFLKAIRLSPGDARFYAHLGSLYARGGQETKARDMFKKALQWDPTSREAQEGMHAQEQGGKGLKRLFSRK